MAAHSMETEIRINGSSEQAVKSITALNDALAQTTVVSKTASVALNDFEKAQAPSAFTRLGSAITSAGNALDDMEKKTKKFGRELTQNVSVPLLGIAAISLKNLYDEGAKLGSSGPMRDFALLIQTISDNFKQLTLTLARDFQPVFTTILGMVNNSIKWFNELDESTRKMVVTVGLIAAAIGPAALALSGVLAVFSQLALVIGPVVTAFTAMLSPVGLIVTSIVALGAGIAGTINLFIQLRESGATTSEALVLSFKLIGDAFMNYVVGTVADGSAKLTDILASTIGIINKDLASGLSGLSDRYRNWSNTLNKNFESSKAEINARLQSIGSSAGDAFSFGLTSKIKSAVDGIKSAFSSMGQTELNKITDAESEAALKKAENDRKAAEEEEKKRAAEAKAAADKLANGTIARQKQIEGSFATGMANAFMSFTQGAKSADEAFRDFANNFLNQITQMILQAYILRTLFPAGGGVLGGVSAGLSGASQPNARGGFVSGPGSSTSDSIHARLSNGEYVMDAKTVRRYGVGFFKGLQGFGAKGLDVKRNSYMPGFADGGLVTSSSSAPQVVIQNSGTSKQVDSTTYDPASAVTTVIMSDIQRNGPISKGMQNAFGVRRSGTR